MSSNDSRCPPRRLRCAVVSQRRHYDQVGFTGLYEFEDLIVSELTDGVLLEPDGRPISRSMHKAGRVTRSQLTKFGLVRPDRERGNTRADADDFEFDVLFLAVRNPFEVDALDSMARWRQRARHVICMIVEVWPPHLGDWKLAIQGFERFDHVFLGLANGVEAFERIVGVPTSYLPPAVDTLAFHPGTPAPYRSIDIINFGRTSDATHRSLTDFAGRENAYYHFSTTRDPRFVDAAAHRQQHAALLQRSQFSIANYAKFDRPSETDGVREVGYRFFECAAAGSIMIGQGPKTPVWNDLFGYPGDIIDADVDAIGIGALLRDLRCEPELLEQYRAASIANALRRNDWAHRWAEMMAVIGLQSTAAQERMAALAVLADHRQEPQLSV